jgi:hypothetical protein
LSNNTRAYQRKQELVKEYKSLSYDKLAGQTTIILGQARAMDRTSIFEYNFEIICKLPAIKGNNC